MYRSVSEYQIPILYKKNVKTNEDGPAVLLQN